MFFIHLLFPPVWAACYVLCPFFIQVIFFHLALGVLHNRITDNLPHYLWSFPPLPFTPDPLLTVCTVHVPPITPTTLSSHWGAGTMENIAGSRFSVQSDKPVPFKRRARSTAATVDKGQVQTLHFFTCFLLVPSVFIPNLLYFNCTNYFFNILYFL